MNSAKQILFILLMSLLLFPLIQTNLNLFEIPSLKGAVIIQRDTLFTMSGWFSGEFQEQREKFLNDNFGFRNVCVRLNNQLAFDLFNKANAKSVIIGKENYLYEENYIRAYFGTDFIGIDSIHKQAAKLKFIQDTLAKLNKYLILILAPGKGSYYPEFIPDRYKTSDRHNTNMTYYLKYAEEFKLNLIDFNAYFLSLKEKSGYILYPKYGIHWSYYGACLAADSIIRYIEKTRNLDLPDIKWNNIDLSIAKFDDADIADGLNLLFDLEPEKLAYPATQFESGTKKIKPSVLVISDSFYWPLLSLGISNSFSNDHFWYYNREIYPDYYNAPKFAEDVNLGHEINKHEIIIILCGEANLYNLGWGIIDKAYKHFRGIHEKSNFSRKFWEEIVRYREYIKNDSLWLEDIKLKAQQKDISIDSMITLDAVWMLQH